MGKTSGPLFVVDSLPIVIGWACGWVPNVRRYINWAVLSRSSSPPFLRYTLTRTRTPILLWLIQPVVSKMQRCLALLSPALSSMMVIPYRDTEHARLLVYLLRLSMPLMRSLRIPGHISASLVPSRVTSSVTLTANSHTTPGRPHQANHLWLGFPAFCRRHPHLLMTTTTS